MSVMKITLYWNPYSTNNIYYRSWKHWFIKAGPRKMKEDYILLAKSQYNGEIIQGQLKIECNIYFWDKRKRDIDNYNKLWMDALSWIVYEDDKQIVELHLYKSYCKENPRIELIIENAKTR